MSSGTRLNPGSGGDLVATDEIAGGVADGQKVQRMKIGYGADHAYADLTTEPATSARQATAQTALDAIKVATEESATEAKQDATIAALGLLSTEAKLEAVRALLASLDGKVPALGQALAGASAPVVLPSAQDVVTYAGASNAIKVADGGSSLTVDAPVGTPVFVRLSDGSSAIATLPVVMSTLPAGSNAIGTVEIGNVTAAPFHTSTIVSGAGGTIKNSPGRVFHIECDNLTGSTVVVNLFNTDTPSAGDAYVSIVIVSGNPASRDLGTRGFYFSSKIYYIVTYAVRSVTPVAATAVSITVSYE